MSGLEGLSVGSTPLTYEKKRKVNLQREPPRI